MQQREGGCVGGTQRSLPGPVPEKVPQAALGATPRTVKDSEVPHLVVNSWQRSWDLGGWVWVLRSGGAREGPWEGFSSRMSGRQVGRHFG